ncbi:alpha/beta fold hydrolase [Streptomyces sp. NPDC088730]|uniref:alpha/beta fold hydrolase n=1 Tax=Streptomyces sp. NPDC088730 TaxID=3365877 RepID=UPI00381E5EE0
MLICRGARDPGIPVERGRELASLAPGSEPRIIEGAGHPVREDAPAGLTAALTGSLETPPAPGPRTAP